MTQQAADRTEAPPSADIELERMLLGALMLRPDLIPGARASVEPRDYYRSQHAWVHNAVCGLTDRGDEVDAITTWHWLVEHHEPTDLVEFGGRGELAGMCNAVLVTGNALTYARQVRRLACTRRAIRAARLLAANPEQPETMRLLEDAVTELQGAGVHGPTGFDDALAMWQAEAEREHTLAVTTGWPTIDHALGTPMQVGEVIVLAARTGVGKTWSGLHIILRSVERRNIAGLVVTLEMPAPDIAERILAHALDTAPAELRRKPGMYVGEVERYAKHARRVLLHDASTSVDELAGVIRQARAQGHRVEVVFVDYLGLLDWRGDPKASIYHRVSETARRLKRVAVTERVVLIVAGQLSREGGTGATRPTLAQLRDSGAIEEAADRIIGFWAPGQDPTLGKSERQALELLVKAAVLKNRKGRLGQEAELVYSAGMRLMETQGATT